MGVVARVLEILARAGMVKGQRRIVYKPDGKTFDHYSYQHVELAAEDILELCALARDQGDEIVVAQTMGCKGKKAGENVVVYANHVFHLCDLCTPAKG